MNPTLYPKPLVFDPDRFSTEKTVGKERFAFLAFGGGPRDCIGGSTYLLIHLFESILASWTQCVALVL